VERRAAFRVVDDFEAALCEFTGAPYAVTVDSCTNALFLALRWEFNQRTSTAPCLVVIPSHTYVGVAQAVRNAGFRPAFEDVKWSGSYGLGLNIVDSAKQFFRGMYSAGTLTCVSFQAGKLLPVGRGGAILHDNEEADDWFRKARLDGRTAGVDYKDNTYQSEGWHCYMTPPDAARGLWLLTYAEDDDKGDWTEYPDLSEATWV
jgi:dTDP-4-amino-4,6-dideoxygalactose transaminase